MSTVAMCHPTFEFLKSANLDFNIFWLGRVSDISFSNLVLKLKLVPVKRFGGRGGTGTDFSPGYFRFPVPLSFHKYLTLLSPLCKLSN
jgi:hypothetical protein